MGRLDAAADRKPLTDCRGRGWPSRDGTAEETGSSPAGGPAAAVRRGLAAGRESPSGIRGGGAVDAAAGGAEGGAADAGGGRAAAGGGARPADGAAVGREIGGAAVAFEPSADAAERAVSTMGRAVEREAGFSLASASMTTPYPALAITMGKSAVADLRTSVCLSSRQARSPGASPLRSRPVDASGSARRPSSQAVSSFRCTGLFPSNGLSNEPINPSRPAASAMAVSVVTPAARMLAFWSART